MFTVHRLLILDRHYECRFDRQWKGSGSEKLAEAMVGLKLKPTDPKTLLPGKSVSEGSKRKRKVVKKPVDPAELNRQESLQLIVGMTYSINSMMKRLTPIAKSTGIIPDFLKAVLGGTSTPKVASEEALVSLNDLQFSYRTSRYRLLYFESPTGWKFIMLVEPPGTGVATLNPDFLKVLYQTCFLNWVIHNPLMTPHDNGSLDRAGFGSKVEEMLFQHFSKPK